MPEPRDIVEQIRSQRHDDEVVYIYRDYSNALNLISQVEYPDRCGVRDKLTVPTSVWRETPFMR